MISGNVVGVEISGNDSRGNVVSGNLVGPRPAEGPGRGTRWAFTSTATRQRDWRRQRQCDLRQQQRGGVHPGQYVDGEHGDGEPDRSWARWPEPAAQPDRRLHRERAREYHRRLVFGPM